MPGEADRVTLSRIAPAAALQFLAGLESLDPWGQMTAQDLATVCERGECFAVEGAAHAVYVLELDGADCWVNAARSRPGGADVVALLSAVLPAQVAGAARTLKFTTRRPGLVRRSRRHGWRIGATLARGGAVVGWTMQKDLQ